MTDGQLNFIDGSMINSDQNRSGLNLRYLL